MHDFTKLEESLDINFQNKNLLTQAFCHRSYINENTSFGLEHNERLEFLGDAVLELVVTEYLYITYTDKPEGELTNWRASLVNFKILAKTAQDLGFDSFLLLSKGESKELGKARQHILANTFEAFVGALFLDRGYKECYKFIKNNLIVELPEIIKSGSHKDAKSRFQEQAQEIAGITPTYQVIKEWGPDHAKNFVIGVFLGTEKIAQGEGSSKQEAELEAAKNAMEAKKWPNK